MSVEKLNQFVGKKEKRKTSNIFLMAMENDNNINKFLSEDRNDSSDEESNENSNVSLKSRKIQEDKNMPFISSDKEHENTDKNTKSDKLLEDTNQEEIQNDEENKIETRRTLMNRILGPVDAGSVRGSIFNLSIFSLGSGCLALPQKIQHMSIIVAVIDILLSGLATYWTLNLMVVASRKLKNCFNYAKIVELLYGKKLSNFLVYTILVYTFGIMILYQVVAYKLIGAIINDLGNYGYDDMNDFVERSFWSSYIYKFCVMYGILHLILLPLCLLKDMSKLRFSSIFGVLSLFFVMIIVIIQFPSYFSNYLSTRKEGEDLNIFDISKGFGPDLLFFKGTATIFYSFNCHIAALPILKGLKDGVNRRIQKVFRRSLLLDVTVYLIIGICGYLTSPIGTPDLIVERKKLGDTDYLMTIGRIFFLFTLLMKLPASFMSFRITLLSLLDYKEEEITNKLNYLITLPTLYISCLVSILYQNISDYISLLGSFNSVIIGFILPGLIYIKANNLPLTHRKNVTTIIIISLLTSIGFSSGIITIIGMIKGETPSH